MAETQKTPQTLLDRVIGYVAPDVALRRMKARATMAVIGGYVGGRYERNSLQAWFTAANSADVDTVYDLITLRSRSRDLVRNTPIATGAVGTMLTNVIGSGLSLMASPDNDLLKMTDEESEAWTQTTEREFRSWSESPDCDITRTQNFYSLQALFFRSLLESGDCFALLPMAPATPKSTYQLRVQLIEADRIATPGAQGIVAIVPSGGSDGADAVNYVSQQVNAPGKGPLGPYGGATAGNRIVGGVEVTPLGAPVAYHVATQHPGDVAASAIKWNRVPAFTNTGRRAVLHGFERTRPGQNRGVPFLAPVIEPLKQLDRYTEAELMAAVVSGMFTVFVKTEAGDGLAAELPSSNGPTLVDGKNKIGLAGGSIVDLVPGEEIEMANPTRPNTAFDGFVESILRQIGVALGLPFEVLIKHFTASYSAARAALLQAWQVFKLRRDFMATQFCQPIYEAWMEEAVASDRIQAPGFFDDPLIRRAYLGAEWVGDAPSQIDPLKEIQAAELRLEVGVSDLKEETMALRGRIWEEVHAQQVKETKARVAGGLQSSQIQTIKPLGAKGSENPAPPGTTTTHPTDELPAPAEPAPDAPAAPPAKEDDEKGDSDKENQ
jgi:lambda family phage portal protein